MINKVTLPFTFCEIQSISDSTAKAPTMAAMLMAASPRYPRRLSATPPNCPDSRTTKATPNAEPLDMPSTEGPASGLWNTVCICSPLTASPAPATMAVSACGRRLLMTMFVQISLSLAPHRMRQTSTTGMRTVPSRRLTTSRTAMDMSKTINFGAFMLFEQSVVGRLVVGTD